MTDQNDTPNVSMANTKKELLEAYQTMKKQLQVRDKAVLDAEKARKLAEKQAALAAAEAQSAQDPVQRLHDLRGDIGRELTSIADRFEAEMITYRKVQDAVQEKQGELETIYQVETSAFDLAALIQAQQTRKEEFEAEIENRRLAFEEEMRESRAKWNRERAEREQEAKEQAEAIKKQRQREKEEYEYAFAREKEQRRNALEDELGAMEKEIAQKHRDLEQELGLRRAELEAREEEVGRQEAEMTSLRRQVEAFPEKLQAEVEAVKKSTVERLTSDFRQERALLESKLEGEKNVLSSRIESLEKLVKAQETQIADLSRRHELAYEKVQDIANRAVAASKREYIPVPVQPPGSNQNRE